MNYNKMGEWLVTHPKISDIFFLLIYPFVILAGVYDGAIQGHYVWCQEKNELRYQRNWRASKAGQ